MTFPHCVELFTCIASYSRPHLALPAVVIISLMLPKFDSASPQLHHRPLAFCPEAPLTWRVRAMSVETHSHMQPGSVGKAGKASQAALGQWAWAGGGMLPLGFSGRWFWGAPHTVSQKSWWGSAPVTHNIDQLEGTTFSPVLWSPMSHFHFLGSPLIKCNLLS